jgi:hypothetical protein
MFLQESIPDTSRYMVMGYTISFVVMTLYVISLYIRNRNLHRDLAMLEEMDKPETTGVAPAKKKRKSPARPTGKRAGK